MSESDCFWMRWGVSIPYPKIRIGGTNIVVDLPDPAPFIWARSSRRQLAAPQVLFRVVEETEDVVFGEAVAALEEVQLDGKGQTGDLASQLLH